MSTLKKQNTFQTSGAPPLYQKKLSLKELHEQAYKAMRRDRGSTDDDDNTYDDDDADCFCD